VVEHEASITSIKHATLTRIYVSKKNTDDKNVTPILLERYFFELIFTAGRDVSHLWAKMLWHYYLGPTNNGFKFPLMQTKHPFIYDQPPLTAEITSTAPEAGIASTGRGA
jgi:hypothetical protein